MDGVNKFNNRVNTHGEFPVNDVEPFDNIDWVKQERFDSRRFNLGWNVCCATTSIIILLLMCIWILYEYKEADV